MELKLFESIAEAKKILKENTPQLVKAAGKNVCIIRREDSLIAFVNECPHLGESLHRGTVNYLGEIVCPLHTYRFNLDTGEEAEHRCRPLQFVKVLSEEEVYLKL